MSRRVILSDDELVTDDGLPLPAAAFATDGLRVSNSVAGDTPGTVVASIEVFDADGNSLGFLAVYDEITVA